MKVRNMVPTGRIEEKIFVVRGEKVLLDSDLAELYEVKTKVFNQAVRRNQERFPDDFMFQLTAQELEELKRHFGASNLRSQIVTSKKRGGRRYLPYAFTEQGVAMLSSVLRSKRAISVNITIMRTFVKMRRLIAPYKDLVGHLDELEKKYDAQFKVVFDAIRQLMAPSQAKRRRIGFRAKGEENP